MARLLIIDDDEDILDSLTMILEANGHEVIVKRDTEDLLDAVRAANPDLILLDVMFPEDPQAGFAAARALAKDGVLERIPVLILSAVNARSNLSFGFSDADISPDFMPVQAFLDKPVEPKRLLARIDELLDD